ncbi:MAG TPA: NADH-quinone oxidoreductase subunit NuoN, partial [Moraxellaceae bacterium]|nr:NADH-quinone oxidoreductase subunit NuoN [Moraxellaceae bacterium]
MIKLEQMIALLPILVVSLTIVAVMLLVALRRHHWWTATIAVAGLNVALMAVVYVSLRLPPVAVTPLLVVDHFALFYMGLVLVTTLACCTLSHAYMEKYRGNREELYLLLLLAALGGMVLACSRHLGALFVGLELLSVPAYGLVAYTFRKGRSLEAGMKYLVLSATASAMLLFGMALVYAIGGTLSFGALEYTFRGPESGSAILMLGTGLMLAGLAFKLSVAPFHIWTPDVYEGAPAPVGAFLATASKAAVFAVLMRFLYESGALDADIVRTVLAVMAGASILVGNLLAVLQTNIKRLLAYSSVAHFGYLLIPLVAPVATPEAMTVYLVTYVVTTLGAFGVVSLMSSPYSDHDADALHNYRGLFWKRPYLTAVMTGMMLSLAGIPVTAGFIGKFYVVAAGVSATMWVLIGLLVVGSAIGLYYYLRVMITMFLPAPGMSRYDAPLDWGERAGGVMVLGVTLLMFALGMYPQPFLDVIRKAIP